MTKTDTSGWRGLAQELRPAIDSDPTPSPAPARPNAGQSSSAASQPNSSTALESRTVTAAPTRRRRRGADRFTDTNQLVGLWLPHLMADELRRRAEAAGLSNSEYAREIFREHFTKR